MGNSSIWGRYSPKIVFMLRINSLKNAEKAVAYYDAALAHGDYYISGEKTSGYWYGKLVEKLGISGEVSREQFKSLTRNRHPVTGQKLKPRDKANARIGYDFTFNACKSASLIHAITKDKAILQAHHSAVQFAMREVEKNMQTQAGQGQNKHYELTGNSLYGAFTHMTTRPVEIENQGEVIHAPDPHLHTHAVVQNLTFHERNNRYQAVEVSTIKKEGTYYESLYHSHFAELLQKAGYEIERKGRFFEIAGIQRETLDKFSNRTQVIEELAEKRNITRADVKAKLGGWSRKQKEESSEIDLDSLWNNRLSEEEQKAIWGAKNRTQNSEKQNVSAERQLSLALDHYLERKSAVPEKIVLARAISKGIGAYSAKEVEKALAYRSDIVKAKRGNSNIITTKEMIRLEEANLEFAIQGRNSQRPINPDFKPSNALLNKDQLNAVNHVLSSKDKVILVGGDAGVGKTTLMQSVNEGLQAAGKKMIAIAPSADASRGQLRDKGFENATTIADFLQNEQLKEAYKNQVLLVDEAAMVGTKDMNAIFQVSEASDMRVVLAGDYKQLQSIQAGDSMRAMEQKAQLPVARVKEIIRQRENPELKTAIKAMADGEQLKAYHILEKQGAVHQIEDKQDREKAISKTFVKNLRDKRSVMLVSPTHKEGQEISDQIRTEMKQEGLLQGEERKYQTQKALSWTESEKQDAESYKRGMIVQFHKRTPEYRHGYQYAVLGKDEKGNVLIDRGQDKSALDLGTHAHFQVYEQKDLSLAQGDRIRITGNGKSIEEKPFHNGQTDKVKGFDEHNNILLESGRTLPKDYGHFTHGYYRTAHAAQGRDAEVLLLSQSTQTIPAVNERTFYVSVSRGAKEAQIFTDDKAELKKAIQKPSDRMDALDVARQAEEQRMHKNAHEKVNQQIREQKTFNHESEQANSRFTPEVAGSEHHPIQR